MEQHDPQANVALVFVHGIFGDTIGTWTNANGSSFFSLLKAEPSVGAKVDMFAFGYTSNMLHAGSFDVQEAANRLHERLQYSKVLDYPALVFVAHSMGGLVVLRELLTHRELLERVPVVVLYATPQEGSQITVIARQVAHNPALEQMLPADRNAFFRELNDEWKSLPKRPTVRCAYEKRRTGGIIVVPWSSATRFCDDVPAAIDTNHINIVKPGTAGHDSLVLLVNALNRFVLSQALVAKLETPDFRIEHGKAVLTMSDPFGKRDARLVNSGGTKLRYILEQFPDRGLYVLPGVGPAEIGPNQAQTLEFVLGYGAKESRYEFVLHSDVSNDQPVEVLVPDLARVDARRTQLVRDALASLTSVLSDPSELFKLKASSKTDPAARDRITQAVSDAVSKGSPGVSGSARWLITAELLNRMNWPALAATALRSAVHEQPELEHVASVRELAAKTGGLAGEELLGIAAQSPDAHDATHARAFVHADELNEAAKVAARMQQIPALAAQGLSLQGDVKWARGDRNAAAAAYVKAAAIKSSPSVLKRLEEVRQPPEGVPTPGQRSAIENTTKIRGNVRANDNAKQSLGVVRVGPGDSVRNVTEIGGDVTAAGKSEQKVGGVER